MHSSTSAPWLAASGPLAPDTTGQLHVLWHDSASTSVNCAEVGVLKQANQVGLGGFLKGKDGGGLDPHVLAAAPKRLHDLPEQPLEGKLADEKIWGLLVLADLSQGNSAGTVSVLLGVAGGWGGLAGSLGHELLARSLASSRLASGLLGACHV